jgi:hypothetical protein
MQSRKHSILEVLTNVSVGTVGAWLITVAVMTWSPYGPKINATMTVGLCTIWSLVRGYFIRRRFNELGRRSMNNR